MRAREGTRSVDKILWWICRSPLWNYNVCCFAPELGIVKIEKAGPGCSSKRCTQKHGVVWDRQHPPTHKKAETEGTNYAR